MCRSTQRSNKTIMTHYFHITFTRHGTRQAPTVPSLLNAPNTPESETLHKTHTHTYSNIDTRSAFTTRSSHRPQKASHYHHHKHQQHHPHHHQHHHYHHRDDQRHRWCRRSVRSNSTAAAELNRIYVRIWFMSNIHTHTHAHILHWKHAQTFKLLVLYTYMYEYVLLINIV